jgi:threonyl-tRNA synthetase
MEELAQNDHRRIGRDLDLFHMQEDAAGSIFWHEKGYTLFRIVENYIRDKLKSRKYVEVKTPQVVDRSLWAASGHLENFAQHMFNVDGLSYHEDDDGLTKILKPVNCPCHVQIFNKRSMSYRNLPYRMAEFGCCHRNEPSGSLHGIMRVRQFTQDDAHIFCTEEQINSETKSFCDLVLEVYKEFGFTDISIALSTRPEQRAGDDATWDHAEAALADAVKACGLEYKVQPGEGAFYGPKLEFALKDNKGREWQCGTLQLDFVLPKKLGAQYTGQDGHRHHPVMLHRAILGSLERFIGILLEHYEGRLPLWLSPVQYGIISIKPDSADYAREIFERLDSVHFGVRAILDDRDENVSQKVKEMSLAGVRIIVAVGGREKEQKTVSVRVDGAKQVVHPLDDFIQQAYDIKKLGGEWCDV